VWLPVVNDVFDCWKVNSPLSGRIRRYGSKSGANSSMIGAAEKEREGV